MVEPLSLAIFLLRDSTLNALFFDPFSPDFLDNSLKHQVNVESIQGWAFNIVQSMLLSKIKALFLRNLPFVDFVSFVANQDDRRVCIPMLIDLLQPEGDIFERLLIRDIKDNKDPMCSSE